MFTGGGEFPALRLHHLGLFLTLWELSVFMFASSHASHYMKICISLALSEDQDVFKGVSVICIS